MKDEELAYLVYKHTSPSGKAYIGQTKNYSKRCLQHRSPLNNNCASFSNAIKKYGWDNFHHEVLIDGLSLDDANTWEELLIAEHGTLSPNGYNLKTGGDNVKLSEETKAKMSKSQRESDKNPERNKKIAAFFSDPDLRRSISERQKIFMDNNPLLKKAISIRQKDKYSNPEERISMSEKQKIIQGTPEARKANSERQKIAQMRPEVRALRSAQVKLRFSDKSEREAHSGRLKLVMSAPEYRKKRSELSKMQFSTSEAREAMSESKRKIWTILPPIGEVLVIHNMKQYCTDKNLNYGSMASVLGKKLTYKGYKLA
jgi:group I intron endonuclease